MKNPILPLESADDLEHLHRHYGDAKSRILQVDGGFCVMLPLQNERHTYISDSRCFKGGLFKFFGRGHCDRHSPDWSNAEQEMVNAHFPPTDEDNAPTPHNDFPFGHDKSGLNHDCTVVWQAIHACAVDKSYGGGVCPLSSPAGRTQERMKMAVYDYIQDTPITSLTVEIAQKIREMGFKIVPLTADEA